MFHRLVFKIRRLIEKVPIIGKSILLDHFSLKEQNNLESDDEIQKTQ